MASTAAPQPAASRTSAGASTMTPIVHSLVTSLGLLIAFLRQIDDDAYCRRPDGLEHGTIGGHVRHTLDHVAALIGALDQGELDYDSRERGTPVEAHRRTALEEIETLRRSLERLAAEPDAPLELRAMIAAAGPGVRCKTSLSRELVFVLSHTIHHQAMIAALARSLGLVVPSRFGYAPSTIAHLGHMTPARRSAG